jgi:integrase
MPELAQNGRYWARTSDSPLVEQGLGPAMRGRAWTSTGSGTQRASRRSFGNPRYRLVITTLAWTGLRVSEALALQWKDIDS